MRILPNVSSRRSMVSLFTYPLLRFAIVGVVAVAVAGCMGPTFVVQQYAGPVRPRETIATLRVNGSDPVRLITLDDEDVRSPLESDSRLHIELLPGRHKIGVSDGSNDRVAAVAFVAEAGKVYRPAYAGSEAHVFEVDRGNDNPGRDVTAPPVVAPPVVAPPVVAPPVSAPAPEPLKEP